MLIANGRMSYASNGNPIFKNISTIDYFVWCPSLFKYINNFIVHDRNPLFSVCHSMLELVLSTVVIATHNVQCRNKSGVKRTLL